MPAPAFRFSYGPRLISGPDCALELAQHLPEGPVLFVTDASLIRLGLPAPALEALRATGRRVTVFDAVEADPSAATVQAATTQGLAAGVKSVVGFGGGSPMDVAKLAAYLLGSGDQLEAIYGVDQAKGKRLPLLLVPTTAGTGSEATPISIVTVGDTEKKGVVAQPLVADIALLDAGLTLGLPAPITAATGIDAMVHAIEAYTSARLKNPLSDALAREALRLLAANLLTACQSPGNFEARSAMLLGSHLAGVAFSNAPVGGVHALAYPLGGHFHIPHGASNALMLRQVLRHNLPAAAPLYAELAPIISASSAPIISASSAPIIGASSAPIIGASSAGIDTFGAASSAGAESFIAAIEQLMQATGLPLTLREHGISHNQLPLLASEAMKQQRLLINNPVPITEADALTLYSAAY